MKICITCRDHVEELDINLECQGCQAVFARKMKKLMTLKQQNKANKSKNKLPDDEIIESYKNGVSIATLARKYNVCYQTIYLRVRDIMQKTRIDIDKLRFLIKKGMKIPDIARNLNIEQGKIYYQVRKFRI